VQLTVKPKLGLELVAACGEYRTPFLLLHEGVLPETLADIDWLAQKINRS
jgi:hypothetical protein